MTRHKTERLLLREWRESDCSDLFEYAQSDDVGPYAGWNPHKSEEESKSIIKMFLIKPYTYAIVLIEENKVIGSIGLHNRRPDENLAHLKQKEIGFALNPKYWGKGIIPEAVKCILDYGFRVLQLDEIWCGHFDFNEKSRRVNEKCGFIFRMKKQEKLKFYNNRQVESLYYSITRNDYDIENNAI